MIRALDGTVGRGRPTFVAGKGWVDERTARAAAHTLELGFSRLVREYGSQNVSQLAAWLMRNEADWGLRELWTSWNSWLTGVAVGRINLSIRSHERIEAIVRSMLELNRTDMFDQAVLRAREVELSPAEKRLLRHDVGIDEEPSGQDVVVSLILARGRERARVIAEALRLSLTPDEWTSLVDAALGPERHGVLG